MRSQPVIDVELFAENQYRKDREDGERNDFLHRFELGRAIVGRAPAVGRNDEAVFEKRDPPAHKNRQPKCRRWIFEVAIPGERHEHVRNQQQGDGRQVGDRHGSVFPVLQAPAAAAGGFKNANRACLARCTVAKRSA